MSEFATYPMALYPPKGEMIIVENEQEHLDALTSWEEPVAIPEPETDYDPVFADLGKLIRLPEEREAIELHDEPETFDETGAPIKRGPGRPRKVVP